MILTELVVTHLAHQTTDTLFQGTRRAFSAVAMPPVFHPAAVSHLLAFAVAGDATDRWLYDSAQHVCHCWRVAAREALLVSEQLRLRARAAALLARMERLSPRPEDYAHRCGPHGRLPLTDMNVLLRGLQACAAFLFVLRAARFRIGHLQSIVGAKRSGHVRLCCFLTSLVFPTSHPAQCVRV